MKDALKKLFTPGQPLGMAATVRQRITPGRYEYIDDAGRIGQADSSLSWSPGDRVIIQLSRIVASAGRAKTIKVYEV